MKLIMQKSNHILINSFSALRRKTSVGVFDFDFVDTVCLQKQYQKVIILGTYHGADSSANLVRQKLRDVLPHACFVELCTERCSKAALLLTGYDEDDVMLPSATIQLLDDSSPWKKTNPSGKSSWSAMNIVTILKNSGNTTLMTFGTLLESATRIFRYIKFRALTLNIPMLNVDMHVAIEEGAFIGSKIVLGDYSIVAAKNRQHRLNTIAADRFNKYMAQYDTAGNSKTVSQIRASYYNEIEKLYAKTLISLRERQNCEYDKPVIELEYSLFEKEISSVIDPSVDGSHGEHLFRDLHVLERKLIYHQVKFEERDEFMADGIIESFSKLNGKYLQHHPNPREQSVVAVVGASHVWGVCKNLVMKHGFVKENQHISSFPSDLKELIQQKHLQH